MENKSQFGRKLIQGVDSLDVFKKLKEADKRKMARLKRQSDQLDETLDRAKMNRNLARAYTRDKHGIKFDYHEMTPAKERKARAKRLQKK